MGYANQLEIPGVDDLYLRRPQLDDAATLYNLVNEPENNAHLARFERWVEHYTLEEAQTQTARTIQRMDNEHPSSMQYLAIHRSEQGGEHVIGCNTLFAHVGDLAVLGYWQVLSACGRGFATMGARRLIEYAREVWELNEIRLRIMEDNIASKKLAQRLGAQPTNGSPSNEFWKIVFDK